jgi:hypothetical protein
MLSWIWFLGAAGNSIDYWSTRKALAFQKKARPHIDEFDGELNPLMNWLMRNARNPVIPFLIIQAFIAFWFWFMSYENSLLAAGVLLCAGYYTAVRCAEWLRINALVKLVEAEGVEPIAWLNA